MRLQIFSWCSLNHHSRKMSRIRWLFVHEFRWIHSTLSDIEIWIMLSKESWLFVNQLS